MAGVEVVPDGARVDDQHRPRVVGVQWVGVVDDLGVEDLADPGYRGAPGPDSTADRPGAVSVKNVQYWRGGRG